MNLNLKYLTTTKNLWDGFKDEKLDHYEKLDFYGGGGGNEKPTYRGG